MPPGPSAKNCGSAGQSDVNEKSSLSREEITGSRQLCDIRSPAKTLSSFLNRENVVL